MVKSAAGTQLSIDVLHGSLPCAACSLEGTGKTKVSVDGTALAHRGEALGKRVQVKLDSPVVIAAGHRLQIEVGG